ncbi:type VI secretion system protein TssA [Marinobacter sp. S6332]|uniref:type VI secretion system protein TssA n=1 Tax=Marinobacter sp. S6332 TaxID=2926403 RepID=UPI001FF6644E|nr:type VI secretion system protein TssA [Marinobacter sp. S6332]MCK0165492.1 type VI secretion system protein TssA [Marinobacter sp. S6332]
MTHEANRLFPLESLLADISPELPCGDDTREDSSPVSPYFTLKDLRNQARAIERQVLIGEEPPQTPQWRQLLDEIPAVLESRSKDLEYVAWLIEALCREKGFEGLAEGFELARELIDLHWENLYPQPDEEGLDTRIAPLVGLNGTDGEGTLIKPIISVPLFFDGDGVTCYAAWHAEQATEVARLDESKAESRIRSGAMSPDLLATAVQETPTEHLVQTRHALERAHSEFRALSDAMDRAMGGDPQPTTNISKALDRCLIMLNHNAGERIDRHLETQQQELDVSADPDTSHEDGSPNTTAKPAGIDTVRVAIESRKEALEQLRRLSDFFLKTEPHSPVSYAILRAVRWSELSLPELMDELISDSGARDGFFKLTGVPAPEQQE